MRRTFSLWESSVKFSDDHCADIRKKIKGDADAFIAQARREVHRYRETAAAWHNRPNPAAVRQQIEQLAQYCATASKALSEIPDEALVVIRHALALDRAPDIRPIDLVRPLRHLGSACTRAAAFKDLKKGQGNVPDSARHTLIKNCAAAYEIITGETAKPSRKGTFGSIMRIVLEAAGANKGLSDDLLGSLLQSAPGRSSPKT